MVNTLYGTLRVMYGSPLYWLVSIQKESILWWFIQHWLSNGQSLNVFWYLNTEAAVHLRIAEDYRLIIHEEAAKLHCLLKITHLCGVRSDLKCAHPHAFRLFVLDCFLHLCTFCHRLCIGGSSKQIMSCNEDIWVVYLNGFVDVLVICDSVTHGFIKNKDITDIRNTQFNVFNGKHGLQNLLVVSAHKFWVEMQI